MADQKKYNPYEEFESSQESGDGEESEKKKGSSEFARMLDESFKSPRKKLSVGDKIKGEVLVVGKEDVFVSTGTMTDGLVPRKELLDAEGNLTIKKGDQIELYVSQLRGSEVRLSTSKTGKNIADDLEDALDMMLPVEGRIVEVCKGGVRVSIMGKLAFCPVSQIDIKRVENPEEYVGKKFEFRITQLTENGRNIVVSRRKLLEDERELSTGSFLEEHKAGDVVTGRVAKLEKFGAFVELAPGIDGLAHISELSWSRVADPAEVVKVGDEVRVKVLKVENKGEGIRISLSLKQAGPEPWENLPPDVKPGGIVIGRVTKCMKFGAFVELVPGIEGLVPLSEMSYTKRVMRSDEIAKEGDRVEVMIKEINLETRKILLSFKDAGADPWALVSQKFPVGTIVLGKVERREPYGLFIQLEEGVTGLLPKSKAMEHPEFNFEKFRIGDQATIQVAEIRREERRISLDIPKDPGSEDWKSFQTGEGARSFGTLGGALGNQLQRALEKKKK